MSDLPTWSPLGSLQSTQNHSFILLLLFAKRCSLKQRKQPCQEPKAQSVTPHFTSSRSRTRSATESTSVFTEFEHVWPDRSPIVNPKHTPRNPRFDTTLMCQRKTWRSPKSGRRQSPLFQETGNKLPLRFCVILGLSFESRTIL